MLYIKGFQPWINFVFLFFTYLIVFLSSIIKSSFTIRAKKKKLFSGIWIFILITFRLIILIIFDLFKIDDLLGLQVH
jgi:hypothetical protein